VVFAVITRPTDRTILKKAAGTGRHTLVENILYTLTGGKAQPPPLNQILLIFLIRDRFRKNRKVNRPVDLICKWDVPENDL